MDLLGGNARSTELPTKSIVDVGRFFGSDRALPSNWKNDLPETCRLEGNAPSLPKS